MLEELKESLLQHGQTIVFGNPGVGKSHCIEKLIDELGIAEDHVVRCVFHPEYSYSDFSTRLTPISPGSKVEYHYEIGHFYEALLLAYAELIRNEKEPGFVLLKIDELNRGNCSSIFGSFFQLLDRNSKRESEYSISISLMEHFVLAKRMEDFLKLDEGHIIQLNDRDIWVGPKNADSKNPLKGKLKQIDIGSSNMAAKCLVSGRIKLPTNLLICATINPEDESIFTIDNAFRRRWDWVFMKLDSFDDDIKNRDFEIIVEGEDSKKYIVADNWMILISSINHFIEKHSESVRSIEGKLLGPFFINIKSKQPVTFDGTKYIQLSRRDVQKLLFHLWDSVFSRDKTPLHEASSGNTPHTFQAFLEQSLHVLSHIVGSEPSELQSIEE